MSQSLYYFTVVIVSIEKWKSGEIDFAAQRPELTQSTEWDKQDHCCFPGKPPASQHSTAPTNTRQSNLHVHCFATPKTLPTPHPSIHTPTQWFVLCFNRDPISIPQFPSSTSSATRYLRLIAIIHAFSHMPWLLLLLLSVKCIGGMCDLVVNGGVTFSGTILWRFVFRGREKGEILSR